MSVLLRPLLRHLLPFVALLAFGPAQASELTDAVRRSGLPADSLSLLAVEGHPGSEKVLLSHNATRPMIPASVTKLITAAVVLKEFHPGTRFETQLLAAGEVDDEVLKGDLVLRGGGDPSFVSETLWVLVNNFARSGIREVRGDIIVDDSYFDGVRIDPGRDTKRVENAYDAPVGAMSFNWNTAAIHIRPGHKIGAPARVMIEPASDFIQVRGEIRTVAGRSGGERIIVTRGEDPEFYGNYLKVSGTIGINAREVSVYRNITRPDAWSGANLRLYLRYLGIKVSGGIRNGVAPAGAKVLAEAQGRPVEQMVVEMNKVSSNYIAEMLTKNLGARLQTPGTMATGLLRLENYLRTLSVGPQEFVLLSPSGLSRGNRLSANALVRVLQDMRGSFQYDTELLASLPIAGVDGTLRKRMRRSPARGWVRAKTGYIDGAITLAGYAGRSNGERVAFAFLYNGFAPGYKVQKLYEELCSSLVTH